MIYNLMLPLAGAFVIIIIILVRQRGKAGREQQNARRRPARPGLVLERSPKEKKAGKSSLSGPVMIALPLIVIGAWLAASYFTPGDTPPPETVPPAAAPENPAAEDSNVLSGRIVMGEDSSPPAAANAPITEAAMNASAAARSAPQAPAAASPADPAAGQAAQAPLSAAAQAMLPTVSRMEQVGLMPARGTTPAANRPKAQKPPVVASAPQAAAPQPAAPAAKPAAASASQAAAPKPRPASAPAAAPDTASDDVILGGGRTFTVHLASFAERGNAEKYLGKLVTARVRDAFVTESTIEGRLWYRVMSGRFASQAEAEAHGSDLRRRNLTASGGRYVIKSIP